MTPTNEINEALLALRVAENRFNEAATPNEVWEMSEERIQVWHFIRADRLTGVGRLHVEVGQTLTVEGPLKLCEHGLHGSRKALDALYYAPGPVACKDEIWGDIIEDNDKLCGRYRKCLAMIDATTVLHEFACLCAERALTREREMGREPDPRSWAAIEAKRKWLRGEIDDAKLAAARDAARAAARDAAWAAAEDAAWAAARATAWDAARDAAWDAQNAKLEEMLNALLEEVEGK